MISFLQSHSTSNRFFNSQNQLNLQECTRHLSVFIECDCHTAGSVLWNTCETYGGQCQCKEGYGDRRCDQCLPGYYGNPSSGCLG